VPSVTLSPSAGRLTDSLILDAPCVTGIPA
jgi:hypothetical protein